MKKAPKKMLHQATPAPIRRVKCLNVHKKFGETGESGRDHRGNEIRIQKGRHQVLTRGRDRLMPARVARIRPDIARHRETLADDTAAARADARSCGIMAGPAALYVAREVRSTNLRQQHTESLNAAAATAAQQNGGAAPDQISLERPKHRRSKGKGKPVPVPEKRQTHRQRKRARRLAMVASAIMAAQGAGAAAGVLAGATAAGFAVVDEFNRLVDEGA